MDVTEHWDFSDPQKTEETFLSLIDQATNPVESAIYSTQVARTHSLRRDFDQAHQTLDAISPSLSPEVEVRWNLEKGRTVNSAGEPDDARPFFERATEIAVANGLEYLAVDAVHMEAIVAGDPNRAIELNERALEMAASATDPTAVRWQGSLLNNLGWSLHDLGEYDRALAMFERTVTYFTEQEKPDRARIGRWSVARTLRSLEKFREALAIQMMLLDEEGDPSGFTSQEIGWNLVALGRSEDAKPYFESALALLAKDDWYVSNNADEIQKMRDQIN